MTFSQYATYLYAIIGGGGLCLLSSNIIVCYLAGAVCFWGCLKLYKGWNFA